MKKITLICFHGSPGTSQDFDVLKTYLPQVNFRSVSRYAKTTTYSIDAPSFVLGYSWGCIPAMDFALKNHALVKGLIFVSPYLFPTNRSLIKKAITFSIFGAVLLKLFGKSSINNMLVKTSYPQDPSPSYKKASVEYLAILKESIIETLQKPDVLKKLETINKLSIQLTIIWGEEDQTSSENAQIAPIKTAVKKVVLDKIKNAGHALIFTNPKELASVIRKAIS